MKVRSMKLAAVAAAVVPLDVAPDVPAATETSELIIVTGLVAKFVAAGGAATDSFS